jgi:hypothetical protein
MTPELARNLLQEPPDMDRHSGFLIACTALHLICTLQGAEKQHSARWNRTRSAEEAVLRVCDIYLPEGMDQSRLVSIAGVVDGPLNDVIKRHATLLLDAVSMVDLPV